VISSSASSLRRRRGSGRHRAAGPRPTGEVVLGVGCEAVGDGLQVACDLGPEVLVDELIHPCGGDDGFITPAGSLTVTPALVDEGAEAGGEPVGFGEVDVVATVGPLLNEHVEDMLMEVVALVVRQGVSEDVEAWSGDPSHLQLDLCLQVGRVGAQQLLPVAEHDRLADVLALEHLGAKRFGHVLNPMLC
jgi:hypothetical protein